MEPGTPFSHLLNPEQPGTLMGFIGGLTGSPSKGQVAGDARGRALQMLSAEIQAGKTPQQALVNFLQRPEGVELFIRDPDLMTTLQQLQKQATPPEPKMTVAGPGQNVYSTINGVTTKVGGAAPTVVQELLGLQEIAKLDPADFQEMARLTMLPAEARRTAQERAVASLISAGKISQETGQKIIGGIIKVLPIKNQYGEETGQVSIIDIASGNVIQPGKANQPGNDTSTIPDTAKNHDGTIDPSKLFRGKATMFLGTGIAPIMVSTLSSILEQIDPKMILEPGAKAHSQRQDIRELHAALINLRDNASGLNIPKITIDTLIKLAPGLGAFDTPHNSVISGIKLLDKVNEEVAANEASTRDPALPVEERKKAASRMTSWRRVQRALPSMPEMVAMEEAIRQGDAGALTLRGAVEDSTGGARRGVNELRNPGGKGTPQPTNDFSKMSPEQLLAIDPKTLDANGRAAYRRRLEALKGKK